MSLFGGGPSGLQGLPLALSSKIKTLETKKTIEVLKEWHCRVVKLKLILTFRDVLHEQVM